MTYFREHLNKLAFGIAVCAAFAAVAVNPSAMQAQADFGSAQGIVSDVSGAAVANAKVTVVSPANGFTREVTTNAVGEYRFTELPSGPYSVQVEASGFGAYKTNISVTVGGHLTLDAKLTVGSQVTTVEVSSDVGADVNTTDAEVSEVISPMQLTELPSLTRNPYDFVALSGSVSSDPNGSTGRGVGVSFSGTRAASTEILLDGVENVDLFGQSVASTVPLDSVSEYRVITNGFSAQYGRASGGIVNLVTKGGSNTYHGTLYEFNRVSALASNTYYEDSEAALGTPLPADHFTQNQFGYSVGGPVIPKVKDKLFFFSNTEWNRVRSAGSAQFLVPTAAYLATTAANTQAYFKQYGQIAAGTTLGPVVPYTDSSGNVFNQFQQATVTAPINAGAGNPINSWFSFDRIDFNSSDKTNMYFRYDSYKDNIFPGTNSLSPYAGFDTGSTDYDQAALASVTHTFSPNLILTSKVTFSRTNGGQPLGSAGVVPGMYLDATNGASTLPSGGSPIVLPGYLPTSPGNAIPFQGPQNFYQFINDVSWTKGAHTFHAGGSFIQVRDNRTFGAYLNAVETLGMASDFEGGVAALTAGNLYSYNVAINPGGVYPCPINTTPTPSCSITLPVGPPDFTKENTFNDGNWYVADTYKLSPRLTLDYGVRWEYYGVQHNTKPNQDTNFYEGAGDNQFEKIRNGAVMPATSSSVHGLIAKQVSNYAPRIGFAYDVFGDGKTSIRGGFGIAYERNFGNVTYNILFNPPYYGIIDLVSNTAGQGQISVSNNNYAPLQGAAGTTMGLAPVELRALDPHMKTAYDYQYNLLIEREIAANVLVSVGYSGTRGIHLYSIANINKLYSGNVYLGDSTTGDTFGDPLNLQYGSINVREANADSYYSGVNLKVEDNNYQKYGLQLTGNYTFSHALDDLSTTFSESENSFNLGYTNPFNPGLDHGNSDYDIRNRLSLEEIYEPKFLEFKSNSLLHTVLGGLEFPAIFSWNSGTPFTVYNCTFALYSCDRTLAVPGLKYHGGGITPIAGSGNEYNYSPLPAATANNYVDPIVGVDDFPTITSAGSHQVVGMGKDQYYDPVNWNLDLEGLKNFRIGERYNLQLRAEFYNVLNHHNLYANAFDSYYAGTGDQEVFALKGTQNGYSQSSADERRNVQLALKFVF